MSEFRDAIAAVRCDYDGTVYSDAVGVCLADAVLAMPEVEWLRGWAEANGATSDPTCPSVLIRWIEG